MDSKQKVDLNTIFQLQEAARDQHLRNSPLLGDIILFISQGITINYEIMSSTGFEAKKQTVVRHFAGDTLSHIVVAVRVALWGAVPESLSVLRGAIESGAQLEFVVRERLYELAIAEAQSKFEKVSYQQVKRKLGELGKNVDQLHGKISNLASHSTSGRFKLSDYTFEGQEYDRLGFSVNIKQVEYIAYLAMLCLMQCTCSLYTAHEQDGHELAVGQEIINWKGRFDELCVESNKKLSTEGQSGEVS